MRIHSPDLGEGTGAEAGTFSREKYTDGYAPKINLVSKPFYIPSLSYHWADIQNTNLWINKKNTYWHCQQGRMPEPLYGPTILK